NYAGVELYQWTGGPENNESAEKEGDQQRSSRTAAPPRPVAAIVGNYLLVADRLSLLQHMISTFQGDQPRLQEELEYKLIVGKLKGQAALGPSMIGFEPP